MPTAAGEDDPLGEFAKALRGHGLDLFLPFDAAPIVEQCVALGVTVPERSNPLGVLIGNSRAVWPHFLASMQAQPLRKQSEHPLDNWVEQQVAAAIHGIGVRTTVHFAHCRLESGYLPLQAWAHALGLLALSPSHLSVHRDFGPWIALRAFMLFDMDAEPTAREAIDNAPCGSCAAPCMAPFKLAVAVSEQSKGISRVTGHWRHWLAVRDACPWGKHHRYEPSQIHYHYARDRSVFG